jgi:hypothetical protein
MRIHNLILNYTISGQAQDGPYFDDDGKRSNAAKVGELFF